MKYERIHIKSIGRTKLFKISEKKQKVYICTGYDYWYDTWVWEEYNSLDEAVYYYVLRIGYKSLKEKLEDWFWGQSQEVPREERKKLIAAERAEVRRQRTEMRKLQQASKSPRVMRRFDGTVEVVYKSRKALARYRKENGLVIIEPTLPNTAAIIINEADFDRFQVIDLNKIANIRVVHRGKNIAIIKGT